MTKYYEGIIASQVSFTRTAVRGTFQFHWQSNSLGEVQRTPAGWIVVDENFAGSTREEAVAKYLVANDLFVEGAKSC